ncbi:MAG: PstS family phosphate ABC transporter substrate-binding protein [Sandaracinaceae bacterium]
MRRGCIGVAFLAAALVACGGGGGRQAGLEPDDEEVDPQSGIRVDGSSTVFPILREARSRFAQGNNAPISLRVSGTGGGFRRFCLGETTINAASRPIVDHEAQECRDHDPPIEFVEIPIAYDGIAVVVHPANYWADAMTVEQLARIWEPAAANRVTRWSDIDEDWPQQPIHLYGPGTQSGTYDYFAQVVVGGDRLRADYTASEDDNYLVRRVRRDPQGISFFGYAYYAGNRGRLKVVRISDQNELNGEGAIAPSPQSVAAGEYQPLSRPLFLYVNRSALDRQPVQDFVEMVLTNPQSIVPEAGYITLRPRAYELALGRLRDKQTGSSFMGARLSEGLTVELLLEHH